MKKVKSILLCLMLSLVPAKSILASNFDGVSVLNTDETVQQEITGTVVDEEGVPLTGASIVVKDTNTGAIADFNGEFSIEVPKGGILVVTYVGFTTQEITIGDQTDITITMVESSEQLEEVVVTALGITKEKKKVGYAVQEVSGESLQKAVAPNVLESLTGRVAGLTITNSNDFFSDPGIFLRGRRPLLVIDGVPNETTDLWNISSDDVESMTVLKAASASALYGQQGINGAILIELKAGSKALYGTHVSVNSSTTIQGDFIRIPDVQTEYGPGNLGRYRFGGGLAGGDGLTQGGGVNDFDYSIWGPKFDGRLLEQFDSPIDPNTGYRIPTPWVSRGPNNLANFIETGLVTSNNISVTSNGDRGTLVLSNTYRYIEGQLPNTRLDVNTFRVRGRMNISDNFSLDGSLQYNYQFANNRPPSRYGPDSPLYNLAIWGGAHFDIRNFKDYWVEGKEGVKQRFVENWRFNNPYALANAWTRPYTKNDIIGFLKLNFKLNDKIKGHLRTTVNAFTTVREEKVHKDIYYYNIPDRNGRYRYNNTSYWENNTDFLLTYNNKFFNDEFGLDVVVGANQRFWRNQFVSANTTQLVVPGVFKLSNSVDQVTPTSSLFRKGVYSGYYTLDLSYKKGLYFGTTGRVDYSTTLTTKTPSFFYPSMSFSAVLSEMFTMPSFVDFLKLRTSYASVGGDFGPYSTESVYGTGGRFRNLPTAASDGTIRNPNLLPSFNTTYEYGIEFNLFKKRINLDLSYYENNIGPLATTTSLTQATGFNGIQANGRTTQRRGFDFALEFVPFKSDNFEWSALFNFDTGKEFLKALPPLPDGTPQTRDGRTEIGGRLGDYWFNDWERSPDGQLVILDNGLPKFTSVRLNQGNVQPEFSASTYNTIRYKRATLTFLIDGRFGGTTYDGYMRDLWRSGSHPDAVHPERELSNIAYVNGTDARTMQFEGVRIVSGELTYDPEGNVIEDTRVFEPSTAMVDYQTWAGTSGMGAWPNQRLSKTFMKLREVTLSYNIPYKWLKKTFIKKATASIFGRDLLYWTEDDDTYADLDQYTFITGDGGLQLPDQRTYGFNVNLKF